MYTVGRSLNLVRQPRASARAQLGKENEMIKYILIVFVMLVLPGCATREGGAILGGALGGVVGSRFGQGNGNTIATGAGAVAGAMVGDRMSSSSIQQSGIVRRSGYRQQRGGDYGAPAQQYSSNLQREYERGRADSEAAYYKEDLRRAYELGRGTNYGSGW